MNPTQPTTTPQMDPQAIALAQAIRRTESNDNFNAKGKSGEFGAYQFMPNTWKQFAKETLGDENAQPTPSNQNAVAYTMIKKWKDQGLNPAQIAAKWNSGSHEGWEAKVGVNKMGVAYDVPAYVKKVTDTYQGLKQSAIPTANAGETMPQAPQTPEKGFMRKVGDFFTGGTQAFGKTIGESLAAPKNAELYSQAFEQYSSITDQLNQAIQQKVKNGEDPSRLQMALRQHLQTKPTLEQFTGDVINKSGEQILGEGAMTGLEALSGGILSSGVKTATAKGASTLGKINQFGKMGAAYGALGAGANAMQEDQSLGGVLGSAAGGAALGYGLGAVTAGAGAVVGKVATGVEKSAFANKFIPQTEARVAKLESFVKDAEQKTAKAYEDALPLTPTQKMREQRLLTKKGDNVYTTLAKYNINPGSDEAISHLQVISDQYENAINHARVNEHQMFNIDEVLNNAFNEVNQNVSSETARKTAKDKILDEVTALLKANKDSLVSGPNGEKLVDSSIMERLRTTGNSWTPFNASDPEKIGKSAGWSLANAVRDQVEKQGTFPAYREANREWGKIIHAQQTLQRISDSGKPFKTFGGLGGSVARKMLSGVLGFHSGGIAGLILSELGSEYAAKILANPSLRTSFNRSLIERFGNTKATPEAIAKLEDEIRAFLDSQSRLPKLNAPTTIYVEPTIDGKPFTPNQTILNSPVAGNKGNLGINP